MTKANVREFSTQTVNVCYKVRVDHTGPKLDICYLKHYTIVIWNSWNFPWDNFMSIYVGVSCQRQTLLWTLIIQIFGQAMNLIEDIHVQVLIFILNIFGLS